MFVVKDNASLKLEHITKESCKYIKLKQKQHIFFQKKRIVKGRSEKK